MKISWNEETPRKIQRFPNPDYPTDSPDLEDVLTSADVDHVAQIFQTPLTGAYNWDYSVQDDRIKKLYELGKQLNWDPQMDIDWDRPWPVEERAAEMMNLHDYP
ncbi:MAG: ferritin, partial [Luminiphilus sp.]